MSKYQPKHMRPSEFTEKRRQVAATIGTTASTVILVGTVAATTVFGNVSNAKGVESTTDNLDTRPSIVMQTEVSEDTVDKERPKALSAIMLPTDSDFFQIKRQLFTESGQEIKSTIYEPRKPPVEALLAETNKVDELASVKLPEEVSQQTTTMQEEVQKEPEQKVVYKYNVTEEERKALEKLVYREARGETFDGQVAVAAVVLTRYKDPNFANSIIGVITSPKQFAKITGVTQNMLDKYPSISKAVDEALKGVDPTKAKFKDGARYFCAVSPGYNAGNNPNRIVIGNQVFRRNWKD